MIWTTANVQRIILDMAGGLWPKSPVGVPATVPAGFDLFVDLGLDSLQRMELAARLNEFFGILHTSATNYLLADTTLDHWTTCILRARQENDESLTFRTSGTSGAQQSIRHSMTSLVSECRFLTELLPAPTQIISSVPAHHIYGFLYTILLPSLWEKPLRLLPELTAHSIDTDTLLIGTPFTWAFLHQSLFGASPIRCRGVSSTAPLSPDLFAKLQEAGVALTEVYGSSETGGLAWRQQPDAAFTLFPYVNLLPGDPTVITRTDTGQIYPVPDRLEYLSAREIRVLGRLDGAVQIAGVNVYPAHIQQVIGSCPLVAECDIHAKADAGVVQLYGAVRLRNHNEATREACLRWIRDHLSAPETPKHLYLY
jgi:long-chain acyl-CoA synthetase